MTPGAELPPAAINKLKPARYDIDFLIVGAQKSATTALFKYLKEHPIIFMPPEKEVEFFSNDSHFLKGKEWYYERYFSHAPYNSIKGEASTNYMMYTFIPERIHRFYPEVKLLASLRHPIERAYSHYRMAVRRGKESKSFHDSIVELLNRGRVPDPAVDHNRDYVQFGEYGRILAEFLRYFDKAQFLVVFSEDLAINPMDTMRAVYRFLGADADFVPPNIDRKYHVGGLQRIPDLHRSLRRQVNRVKRFRWAQSVLRRVNLEAFFFWLETEMNVREEKHPPIEERTYGLLLEHYARDIMALERAWGIRVPWEDFH